MSDTKVYSEYPVIVQYVGGRGKGGNFSSMDGSTNPKQVLAFQKWVNKFKFKKKLIAEDSKWGPKTSAAWNQFGSEYLDAGAKVAGIMDSFGNQSSQQSNSGSASDSKEKTGFLDKALGLFGKGKEAVGKVKGLKEKVMMGDESKEWGEKYDTKLEPIDEPASSKSKTGKIILWGGVAITAAILLYVALKPKKA